jgi:hypothetical protein
MSMPSSRMICISPRPAWSRNAAAMHSCRNSSVVRDPRPRKSRSARRRCSRCRRWPRARALSSSKKPSEVMPSSAPGQLRDHGAAAGGDHDRCRPKSRARRPAPTAPTAAARGRAADRRAALEVALVDVVEPHDEGVALALSAAPSRAAQRDRSRSRNRRIVQRVPELAGVPHDFLRYAADVDAGAPEAVRSRSAAARAPYSAARCAQARPPLPPPITIRS